MQKIKILNRETKQLEVEQVYGRAALEFLYGSSTVSKVLGKWLLPLIVRWPFCSWLYGLLQSTSWSARKIQPFIEKYQMDATEFLEPVDSFSSFNAFFYRKLKSQVRPIEEKEDHAIIPADGRYLFYQDISKADGFIVKGKTFSLHDLLKNDELAKSYERGSMVIARLCPTDYHRFHFPCAGTSKKPQLINGYLSSVNPLALKQNVSILTENKRFLTRLFTRNFGQILYIEVGATNVGSIHHTFISGEEFKKGEEKGYFSFGASALILLFEPNRIIFDEDLLQASSSHQEIKCLFGQPMGRKLKS